MNRFTYGKDKLNPITKQDIEQLKELAAQITDDTQRNRVLALIDATEYVQARKLVELYLGGQHS